MPEQTRDEAVDAVIGWLTSLRSDINTMQNMLIPIRDGWAFKTNLGQTIPMTEQQKIDHLNAGVAVLQSFQTKAATFPDISGILG